MPSFFKTISKTLFSQFSEKEKNEISNLFLKNFSEKNQKLEKLFDILDSSSQIDLYKNILTKSKIVLI